MTVGGIPFNVINLVNFTVSIQKMFAKGNARLCLFETTIR